MIKAIEYGIVDNTRKYHPYFFQSKFSIVRNVSCVKFVRAPETDGTTKTNFMTTKCKNDNIDSGLQLNKNTIFVVLFSYKYILEMETRGDIRNINKLNTVFK